MTFLSRASGSLLALALACWANSSAAQSSLTISGVLDLGLSRSDSGSAQNPGAGTRGSTLLKQGSASRLGIRGNEDLGGGLYAGFELEHRFLADTGEQDSDAFFQAVSVVKLGSLSWGELYLGRKIVPAYSLSCEADPTCWSYTSQLGRPYAWANYSGSAASDNSSVRRNNTVGYRSPTLAGWSSEIAYAYGEGERKRSLGANLEYRQGPVYLGLGYDGADAKNRLLLAAVGYGFGMVRPLLLMADAKGGPTTPGYRGQSASLSFVFPTAWGRMFAGLGHLRSRATPADGEERSTKLFLGGDYNLSRRTTLYVNFGSARTTGLTSSNAYDAGIRHAF